MKKFESYEENLKDYLDLLKEDFKLLLSSVIPGQKNLIKTLLWLNITFIGLTIALLRSSKIFFLDLFLSMPFTFSSFAVAFILYALTKGRTKAFMTPPIEEITKLINIEYERPQGLLNLIGSIQTATKHNTKIIKFRAHQIHRATVLTIISGITLVFAIIIIANINLGEVMAEEKKETLPPTKPMETSKPKMFLSTNSTNIVGTESMQSEHNAKTSQLPSKKEESKKEGKI